MGVILGGSRHYILLLTELTVITYEVGLVYPLQEKNNSGT